MVSSIGSTGAQTHAVDQLFKKADANSDGKLTKDELTVALESAGDTEADSKTKADAFFKMLDTSSKGYVTKNDVTQGSQKAQGAPPGTGARPAGGGGGGGGGGGSTSATSATTDPADTNGDGVVSAEEQLAYQLKQYQTSNTSEESTTEAYA